MNQLKERHFVSVKVRLDDDVKDFGTFVVGEEDAVDDLRSIGWVDGKYYGRAPWLSRAEQEQILEALEEALCWVELTESDAAKKSEAAIALLKERLG